MRYAHDIAPSLFYNRTDAERKPVRGEWVQLKSPVPGLTGRDFKVLSVKGNSAILVSKGNENGPGVAVPLANLRLYQPVTGHVLNPSAARGGVGPNGEYQDSRTDAAVDPAVWAKKAVTFVRQKGGDATKAELLAYIGPGGQAVLDELIRSGKLLKKGLYRVAVG